MSNRFSEQEVVVLGLNSQVLEDGVRPEPLHVIPILNLTMTDRVVDAISGTAGGCKSLVADEEVKILCPPFSGQMGACCAASS